MKSLILLALSLLVACAAPVDDAPESLGQASSAISYGTGTDALGTDAFASGINCHANGMASTAMGDDCTTGPGAYRSVVIGHSSSTTQPDTVTFGENCSTTADGAVAIGYTAQATASWGLALGAYVTAAGRYSSARGVSVTTSRQGEDAHGSGHPGAQGFHAIDLYAVADGAPAVLKESDGTTFLLSTQTAHAMRVRILVLKGSGSGAVIASEERALTVIAVPGPLVTVIGEATTAAPAGGLAAQGWGLTIAGTGAGSLELRLTCDPGADTVKCLARVEWSQIAIPS